MTIPPCCPVRPQGRRGPVVLVAVVLLALSGRQPARSDDHSAVAARHAGPHQMAEATIAFDPDDERHLVAGADPYLAPVRIALTESKDGGGSWLPRTDILPEGFAKSYDPSVAVDRNGRVVVVGGASGVGATHCQPGSAIFLATLEGGVARYQLVRDARPDGAYVDRPRFASDAAREGTRYVTWTESSGPGASCLGTPLRSTTMFTRSHPDGSVDPPRALPGTGIPAPFGTALAVGDGGVLTIVVAEFDPGRLQRVVVYTSVDQGATITGPVVVGEGPPVPSQIPQLGGFTAPLPTVAAGPTGRLAVAWTERADPGGFRARVMENRTGRNWQDVSPPGTGTDLYSTLTYDRQGTLWLLTAAPDNGKVEFRLRSRGPLGWSEPVVVGAGTAGGYVELGQFLGLSASGRSVATAVPVDGPGGSTLQVFVQRTPAVDEHDVMQGAAATTLRTGPVGRDGPSQGPTRPGDSRRRAGTVTRVLPWALAIVLLGMLRQARRARAGPADRRGSGKPRPSAGTIRE